MSWMGPGVPKGHEGKAGNWNGAWALVNYHGIIGLASLALINAPWERRQLTVAGLGCGRSGDSRNCFCNFPTTPEDFPMVQRVKNPPAPGDEGSIPASARSPGGGNGNPLQDSRLENSMDREAC